MKFYPTSRAFDPRQMRSAREYACHTSGTTLGQVISESWCDIYFSYRCNPSHTHSRSWTLITSSGSSSSQFKGVHKIILKGDCSTLIHRKSPKGLQPIMLHHNFAAHTFVGFFYAWVIENKILHKMGEQSGRWPD